MATTSLTKLVFVLLALLSLLAAAAASARLDSRVVSVDFEGEDDAEDQQCEEGDDACLAELSEDGNGLDEVDLEEEVENRARMYSIRQLSDYARSLAYLQALTKAVTPESNVLVANAALGLLPMMAARLGAKSVTALENRPLFLDSMQKVIADNSLNDKILVLENNSFNVEIGTEPYQMPTPADIVVVDMSHGTFFDNLLLHDMHALRDRNIVTSNATIMPRSARIYFQCTESTLGLPRDGLIHGFNMSAVRHHRKTGCSEHAKHVPLTNLSDAVQGFYFDFSDFALTASFTVLRIPFKRSGSFNSLSVFWEAYLDQESQISIGNGFGSQTFWDVVSCMFDEDIIVQAGMTAVINVAHDTFGWQFTARVEGLTPKEEYKAIVLVRNMCKDRVTALFVESKGHPRRHLLNLEQADVLDVDARDRHLLVLYPGDRLYATYADEIDADDNLIEIASYVVRRTAVDKQNYFLITCE